MNEPKLFFDAETFQRTASSFASKRKALTREEVEALAGDVVQRLVSAARRGQQVEHPSISDESVAAFADALVQPGPEAALRFIAERREEGLTREGVYRGYIGAAACRLGEQWDEGILSFFQVTTGTGHLYALMRSLRAERPPMEAFDPKRTALFATVPGEDHGIGITVAADLFRESGWEIDLQLGTEFDELITHVSRIQPQVIGLSLSTDLWMNILIRLVVSMRIECPRAIIGVAAGEGVEGSAVLQNADVDLLFHDAHSARLELDRLVKLRGF